MICSRRTWLMRSILTCMTRKSGTPFKSMNPTIAAMIGRITKSSPDSWTSTRRAMITPPTAMIGAATSRVRAICRKSWICWTSLVLRVMSDAVPSWFSSRAENVCRSEELDLLDVVGVARDERRGAELVQLPRGECLHLPKDGAAQVPADTHRCRRSPVHGDHGDDPHADGDPQHHSAGPPYVRHVAFRHPVVDDVRVQIWQVQVGHRLDRHEHDHERDFAKIGSEIGAQESDQHLAFLIGFLVRAINSARSMPAMASVRGTVPNSACRMPRRRSVL